MSQALHALTQAALDLDPADRLRLANELIDSVEDPADAEWCRAWTEEVQRRSKNAEEREGRGERRGAEWSEVRAHILSRHRQ